MAIIRPAGSIAFQHLLENRIQADKHFPYIFEDFHAFISKAGSRVTQEAIGATTEKFTQTKSEVQGTLYAGLGDGYDFYRGLWGAYAVRGAVVLPPYRDEHLGVVPIGAFFLPTNPIAGYSYPALLYSATTSMTDFSNRYELYITNILTLPKDKKVVSEFVFAHRHQASLNQKIFIGFCCYINYDDATGWFHLPDSLPAGNIGFVLDGPDIHILVEDSYQSTKDFETKTNMLVNHYLGFNWYRARFEYDLKNRWFLMKLEVQVGPNTWSVILETRESPPDFIWPVYELATYPDYDWIHGAPSIVLYSLESERTSEIGIDPINGMQVDVFFLDSALTKIE